MQAYPPTDGAATEYVWDSCATTRRGVEKENKATLAIHKKANDHKINFFINFIITGAERTFLSIRRIL